MPVFDDPRELEKLPLFEGLSEEELSRLKALPKPALYEVVTRAGVEGVKPRDGVGPILTRVRNRLTAARRARERAEV